MSDSGPTLWHIGLSHYSEKARWALDHKEVPHSRRAVTVPGVHIPAALWLTRGASQTFPVLEIDGRRIGDSTEIIAALVPLEAELSDESRPATILQRPLKDRRGYQWVEEMYRRHRRPSAVAATTASHG